jgi:ABC-type uncharacterized transport system substrate-binding protein
LRVCSRPLVLYSGILAILAVACPALAHPHVWVTMRIEIVYDAGGSVSALRHIWKFDEIFSTFATSGLGAKDGRLRREQLVPLAERYVSSLKPYDFFTYVGAAGRSASLGGPSDYWLEYEDGLLSLHMSLPLTSPVKAGTLDVAIYDPTYFVDLSFMQDRPVTLVDAPAKCTVELKSPSRPKVDESFFASLAADSNWAAQLASAVSVRCP